MARSPAANELSDEVDAHGRTRQLAMNIAGLGLIVHALISTLSIISGDTSRYFAYETAFYAVALTAIGVSGVLKIRVRSALNCGLILIFLTFWLFAFLDVRHAEIKQNALALTIFIPFLTACALNFPLVIGLGVIHAGCMFLFYPQYATVVYGSSAQVGELVVLGAEYAVLSFAAFLAIAIITRIRNRKHQLLVALINKQKILASTDSLTGLLNRDAFLNKLEQKQKTEDAFCLAFVDLDRFKPLNDQHGHSAGDELLRRVAARLLRSDSIEFAGRLGGDEFALVFVNEVTDDSLHLAMEYTHKALCSDVNSDFGILSVGASIGCVTTSDLHCPNLILPAAEVAMRRAKQNNQAWVRYDCKIDDAAIATSALELEFRQALRTGKLRAAVQPIVRANDTSILGYELLSRWIDSGLDRDPGPDEFIPVAENLGLLNDLLWHTLDECFRSLPGDFGSLAINVSPSQLLATGFLDKLSRVLARHDVHPSKLTLEVTEKVALRNVSENVAVLKSARDMGMRIALDDFGTGYSSLSTLDTLPVDKIKIDQSLVRGLDVSNKRNSILFATIQMARQLKLTCCVEGIETQDIAELVASYGANEMQGYLFGKPVLVSEHIKALSRVA